MTNIELRLYDAGKIAIPLAPDQNSTLNPQPNFLIIENIFDYIDAPFPDGNGGIIMRECQNTFMKLVYREVLLESNGKPEEIREVLMDNVGNIPIPEEYVAFVKNHERMVKKATELNQLLSLFSFRGILAGHTLAYDPALSTHFLNLKETLNTSVEPTVEPVIE